MKIIKICCMCVYHTSTQAKPTCVLQGNWPTLADTDRCWTSTTDDLAEFAHHMPSLNLFFSWGGSAPEWLRPPEKIAWKPPYLVRAIWEDWIGSPKCLSLLEVAQTAWSFYFTRSCVFLITKLTASPETETIETPVVQKNTSTLAQNLSYNGIHFWSSWEINSRFTLDNTSLDSGDMSVCERMQKLGEFQWKVIFPVLNENSVKIPSIASK